MPAAANKRWGFELRSPELVLPTGGFWPATIPINHNQLRNFLVQPAPGLLLYAQHHFIHLLDLTSRTRRLVAELPFEIRCIAAAHGWVCAAGGEESRYVRMPISELIAADKIAVPVPGQPTPTAAATTDSGVATDAAAAGQPSTTGATPSDRVRAAEPEDTGRARHRHRVRLAPPPPPPPLPPLQPQARADRQRPPTFIRFGRSGSHIINSISITRIDDGGGSPIIVALLANNDHHVRIIDVERGVPIQTIRMPFAVNHASLSPNGNMMVAVGDSPTACVLVRHLVEPSEGGDGGPGRETTSPASAERVAGRGSAAVPNAPQVVFRAGHRALPPSTMQTVNRLVAQTLHRGLTRGITVPGTRYVYDPPALPAQPDETASSGPTTGIGVPESFEIVDSSTASPAKPPGYRFRFRVTNLVPLPGSARESGNRICFFHTAWSGSGQYCATGSESGQVAVLDMSQLRQRAGHKSADSVVAVLGASQPSDNSGPGSIRSLAFAPAPWDLLVWAEDRSRMCIADLRAPVGEWQRIALDDSHPGIIRMPVHEAGPSANLSSFQVAPGHALPSHASMILLDELTCRAERAKPRRQTWKPDHAASALLRHLDSLLPPLVEPSTGSGMGGDPSGLNSQATVTADNLPARLGSPSTESGSARLGSPSAESGSVRMSDSPGSPVPAPSSGTVSALTSPMPNRPYGWRRGRPQPVYIRFIRTQSDDSDDSDESDMMGSPERTRYTRYIDAPELDQSPITGAGPSLPGSNFVFLERTQMSSRLRGLYGDSRAVGASSSDSESDGPRTRDVSPRSGTIGNSPAVRTTRLDVRPLAQSAPRVGRVGVTGLAPPGTQPAPPPPPAPVPADVWPSGLTAEQVLPPFPAGQLWHIQTSGDMWLSELARTDDANRGVGSFEFPDPYDNTDNSFLPPEPSDRQDNDINPFLRPSPSPWIEADGMFPITGQEGVRPDQGRRRRFRGRTGPPVPARRRRRSEDALMLPYDDGITTTTDDRQARRFSNLFPRTATGTRESTGPDDVTIVNGGEDDEDDSGEPEIDPNVGRGSSDEDESEEDMEIVRRNRRRRRVQHIIGNAERGPDLMGLHEIAAGMMPLQAPNMPGMGDIDGNTDFDGLLTQGVLFSQESEWPGQTEGQLTAGVRLFVATESGIFDFSLNIPGRGRFPASGMR